MISIEHDGTVMTVTLDRPQSRNAFTPEMVVGLGDAIATAASDPDCRCLVITGAGDHFCTGRDLKATKADGPLPEVLERDGAWSEVIHRLHASSKPSVAVVRGFAVAGGFTLSMGCDFVLADRSARFGALEMANGFPAAVATPILANLIGPRLALELAMMGQPVEASRLYEMGLINRLAEDADELAREAAAFTGRLAELDPSSIALTKELHRAAQNMPLANSLDMGKQLNSLIATSGVFDAAAKAFEARKKKRQKS
jgi:enoyl-CoA hydratase/carnithine racemase